MPFFLLLSFQALICFCLSFLVFFCIALSSSYFLLAMSSLFLFSLFSIWISRSFLALDCLICMISLHLSAFHFLCFSASSRICFIILTLYSLLLVISPSNCLILSFQFADCRLICCCSQSFCLARRSLSSRSFSFFLQNSSSLVRCQVSPARRNYSARSYSRVNISCWMAEIFLWYSYFMASRRF